MSGGGRAVVPSGQARPGQPRRASVQGARGKRAAPGAAGLMDATHVRGHAGPQTWATVVRKGKTRKRRVLSVSFLCGSGSVSYKNGWRG